MKHGMWIVVAGTLLAGGCPTGCQKRHRRGGDAPDEHPGRPAAQVEPRSDPRFPDAPDVSARRGFWVEQPVETGPLSATGVANAVAGSLSEVRRRCWGAGDAGCDGLRGRILLELEVESSGRVASADIAETSVYDRTFQTCLLESARHWTLPKLPGDAPVEVLVPVGMNLARQPDVGARTD